MVLYPQVDTLYPVRPEIGGGVGGLLAIDAILTTEESSLHQQNTGGTDAPIEPAPIKVQALIDNRALISQNSMLGSQIRWHPSLTFYNSLEQ